MARSAKEVWFINRGLVILRPKEPFVKWVQASDPKESVVDAEFVRSHVNGYLIPELDGADESWEWIRHNARDLFEFALSEWYSDESLWPKRRTWTSLQEWFDVEFIEVVWDMVDAVLTSDPNDPEHQL